MNQINWPNGYIPGDTDFFVSNEIIVPDLSVMEVWPFFFDTSQWPRYYGNITDVFFPENNDPDLFEGARFSFNTLGLPIQSEIVEYTPPTTGLARLAWHGWIEGENRLDAYHAWLFEDLPGGRVRILTQESMIGGPAKELATLKPNPMLNAHQEWIESLAKIAREEK